LNLTAVVLALSL